MSPMTTMRRAPERRLRRGALRLVGCTVSRIAGCFARNACAAQTPAAIEALLVRPGPPDGRFSFPRVRRYIGRMPGRLIAIAWKLKPRAPMQSAEHALVDLETGIAGDFRGAAPNRQLTIVFAEDWAAACRDLKADVPWTARRANLLVAGVLNPKRAGGVLRFGEVVLAITGETEPCGRMDEAHAGLRAALSPDWRGGLMTRVIAGGALRVGDPVILEN
jgi:MOSC domain-containing protein YiiM